MTKVFISYSHKDEAWKDRLQTQLAVLEMEGLLSVWEDRQIALGDSWYPEIETALNTADVAILLISADFLTSRFIRGEEIPRLLERREQQGIRVIPLILKPCPWKKVGWLSAMQGASRDNVPLSTLVEHQQDDILCKLAEKIHDLVGTCRSGFSPTISPTTPSIHSDRLPTVKGGFFGRIAELQLLNDAWSGNTTRIIQFIAPGGTGKTKLLRHWLNHTANIPVLFEWSFYAQGSSEDKQTSATPFFSHAFAKLGSTRERFASEEDKGDHLAELLHGKRYVLVLDGLEPLQHGGAAMRGALKDKAIRQLLRQLARHPCGLCIITTRLAVHELSDHDAPTVIRHDLQNLMAADGIQLLQSLGVTGSAAELGKAVGEYGGHALALSLLGNVLRLRHQGDVRKRDTLTALVKATGNRDSRHAFKVMQAYAEWFAGEPELALLHLLGLFDHPIGQDVLQMLWDAQIPHLTAGIDEDEWLEAIASLREEHHLLSQHDGGGDLDCHPLIREYFGGQLQNQQPQAWQQAHERLYEYYKALPEKEFPDTLEEMQPLFSAVAHGCAAGLHSQALEEVYWPRLRRGEDNYICKSHGAFSDSLAVLAFFFTKPWENTTEKLEQEYKEGLLDWVSYCLRSLGRLHEAEQSYQAYINIIKTTLYRKRTAIAFNNLSEVQLLLGKINEAEKLAKEAIKFASDNKNWYIKTSATHAYSLLQRGDITAAADILVVRLRC
ncbi:TIR domain-containing protein [Thiothrix eikelboomii]|uniref:TIR domain-containing protein n=1 Tax=Thiothrix eikelboomii TaxID=92487 RepID=UPI003BAE93D5